MELALDNLLHLRVQYRQPGLLKLPSTDKYCWQAGFTDESTILYSIFFSAHIILRHYEALSSAGFGVDTERIFLDGKLAFERIMREDFDKGLEREEAELKIILGEGYNTSKITF